MPESLIRGKQITEGGEGYIYEVQNHSDLLLKIYKDKDSQGNLIVTNELLRKLEYMRDNPPVSLVKEGNLAWPIQIIYEQRRPTGFLMPNLTSFSKGSLRDISLYRHPSIEQDSYDTTPSVQSRIGIAINLAYTVSEIHKAGYVIGDMNHENIGVDKKTGKIMIVDCDSFTVTDNSGITLRTNVCMKGYLAPEIIRHCDFERAKGHPHDLDTVCLPTFTKESDLFCLAIHIFKLLMNGIHPFLGVDANAKGSHPTPFTGNEGIKRNNYIFKPGFYTKAASCLLSNEISPKIKNLFDKAFLDGNVNRYERPSAEEWFQTLTEYLGEQKQCSDNGKHQYYNKLSICPYCEADKRFYSIQPNNSKYKPYGYNPYDVPKSIVIPDNHTQNQEQNKVIPNKQRKIRTKHIVLAVASVFCGLIFLWSRIVPRYHYQPTEQQSTEQYSDVRFVKLDGLRLLSGPGNNYETLYVLPKNFPLCPLANVAKSGDWIKVGYFGTIGWVDERYLSPTINSDNETFSIAKYVKVDGLNLRSGPGTNYSTIRVLPINAVVYLSDSTNQSGNWVKVKYNDYTGWVNKNYLWN